MSDECKRCLADHCLAILNTANGQIAQLRRELREAKNQVSREKDLNSDLKVQIVELLNQKKDEP